jgi:hypothetical protein
VRGLLAGEDEIVAVGLKRLDHALAGEEVVGQIHRTQRLQARAVLHEPALDGVALAVLLLGAVLFDDDPRIKSADRRERDDLGMSRRDHRRTQHGMIALDLAVAALARLAMRAGDLLAAEILGAVEGDERSAAEPAERLAHRRFEKQSLRVREARREQSRIRAVEHVPDIIVGRDLLGPEQGLAIRPSLAFLQLSLKGQKRRALHEKHGEGGQTEIRHGNIAAPSLARVRKRGADRLKARQKRRQILHPQRESCFS